MKHEKPDFIIVGAMKGGTSTLSYILGCQDDIILPQKELNYFDNDINFNKGDYWYRKQFYSKDYSKIWGEKTATYHYDQKVPERIYKYNPEIKLIWILRNPVDRAYSNYWHRVKYGVEYETFEAAIKNEILGKQKDIWGTYLKRSNYVAQIKNYRQYFNENQMHIIIFEEFIKNIEGKLKETLHFLSLRTNNPIIPPRKKSNITYLPGSPKVLKYSKLFLGKTMPFKIVRKMFEKKSPGYPEMKGETVAFLESFFSDSIDELEELLNLDLSVWRGKK